MSSAYGRLAAIRDYWMPRNLNARIEVRVTDVDEILRELVRVTTLAAERAAPTPPAQPVSNADELERLRAELETERLRLAACGVVALANTPESASKAREMRPEYRSASLDDVEHAVNEQMRLRAELAEANAELSEQARLLGISGSVEARLLARVAELEREVAEAKRDADRYRWLRAQQWDTSPLAVVVDPKRAVKLGHDLPSLDRLDAAIDDAMRKEVGE